MFRTTNINLYSGHRYIPGARRRQHDRIASNSFPAFLRAAAAIPTSNLANLQALPNLPFSYRNKRNFIISIPRNLPKIDMQPRNFPLGQDVAALAAVEIRIQDSIGTDARRRIP
jgi:hypothetical protein